MHQEILINVEPQEKRVAIIENKALEEFHVERQGAQRLVGNIYKGRVEAIVPAIGAAFVNIGLEKNGFLYVQDLTPPDYEKIAELVDKSYNEHAQEEEKTTSAPSLAENRSGGSISPDNNRSQTQMNIKDMLKVGQEILVQLVKEPLGTKGARLTTHISLPGRYLVLMPCDVHKGISRRIQDSGERARLKEILKGLKVQNMGLIVRTVSSGSTKRDFLQDLRYLTNLWRRIKVFAQKKHAPCIIHEDYDLVLRTIRDNFTSKANKLFVDSKDEYRKIIRFLGIFSPSLRSRVQFYHSEESLFEKKGVEDEIAKIYNRQVSLKSGGHIVIEPTESLVAIDVNSGKFTGKKDPEENAYLVNLEAAREIARQVRLRDMGGIIIIDFIDMKLAKHRQKVFEALAEVLKRDYAKTNISRLSDLGLIEMSRQRSRQSLESVAYQSCPYCQGKGMVKSPATMAIFALKKIKKMLQKTRKKTFLVFAHPEVASCILNQNRYALYELERKFRAKLVIKQNPSLHMEDLKIESI